MQLKRALIVLVGITALLVPLINTTSAQAAGQSEPISCGMVVTHDVRLYLAKDLYCSEFGVRIYQPQGEDGTAIPDVTVDLRGHTLRGPGTGRGITAFAYPGQASVKVKNGVLKDWEIALGGDSSTRASRVALVGNTYGFFCNGGCNADRVLFQNNTQGMDAAGESSAVVTRSTFIGNEVGAAVTWIWTLDVASSLFIHNKTAMAGNGARPKASHTAFVGNGTAILIQGSDPGLEDQVCADLTKVAFAANRKNLVGPRCAR